MDEEVRKLFELVNGEIQDLKKLILEVRKESNQRFEAHEEQMSELRIQTNEIRNQTNELRELVVITRLQMDRPWWKKMLGLN